MLRLLCLLAGLAATVTGLCTEPFKEVGDGCYYFSIEDDHLQMTWAEARQYCQSLGSEVDLAMLDYVCDDFRNLCNYLLFEGACTEPFKEVGEGCYYFSQEDRLELSWTKARQYCQSLGNEADLAVLDYLCDDLRNLGDYILTEDAFLYFDPAWVGATGGAKNWFWVDGRSLSIFSSFWGVQTPSGRRGCVQMVAYASTIYDTTNRRPALMDASCFSNATFICQDYYIAY